MLGVVENILNFLVTLASGGFETIAIQNGDVSAAVLGQPALLQGAGCHGHSNPAHAPQIGSPFLSQKE